jgi:hypothetical protein
MRTGQRMRTTVLRRGVAGGSNITVSEGGVEPPRSCDHRNLNPISTFPTSTSQYQKVNESGVILLPATSLYQPVFSGWVAKWLQWFWTTRQIASDGRSVCRTYGGPRRARRAVPRGSTSSFRERPAHAGELARAAAFGTLRSWVQIPPSRLRYFQFDPHWSACSSSILCHASGHRLSGGHDGSPAPIRG